MFYYYMAMTAQKFLYYTPWCVTDGGMIACGLGYNGYDEKKKKHLFDRLVSIDIIGLETATSVTVMI